MPDPIRIFISFDNADFQLAADLAPWLQQGFAATPLSWWNPEEHPPEQYRANASAWLETAHLFLAVVTAQYAEKADTRWEMARAVQEHKRRPNLRILVVMAKHAFIPETLQGFPVAPGPEDPVEGSLYARDKQLKRVAQQAVALVGRTATAILPKHKQRAPVELPLSVGDLSLRLESWLDRIEYAPIFQVLKSIGYEASLLKRTFEAEDAFSNLYQQTRGLKTELQDFLLQKERYREDLRRLIRSLYAGALKPNWRELFIPNYFHFAPGKQPVSDPYYFLPTESILVPETLNIQSAEQAASDNIGALSYQQQQDFRRNLLLAQDAIAVNQFARAYTFCENTRLHVDPQSAQLYEYLLITYVHQEKSERIITDALFADGRLLSHVTLYAGRLRLYQEQDQCPTRTGAYNRRITAEILSDGMAAVYDAWPNDYMLDTGRNAADAPKNLPAARKFIEAAQLVYRAIHPMRGGPKILINELCGGGKFNWVSRIAFAHEEIRLLSDESFDLESQIEELLGLVAAVDTHAPDKQARERALLRENLYWCLLAKRQRFFHKYQLEKQANRQFLDLHESVARFIYACLLGRRMFGDDSPADREQSFLRLALEYLLPGLVVNPDPVTQIDKLRWFDLNENGDITTHADAKNSRFDARAVTEKIIGEYAGKAAWLQIGPNIKQEVYLQYIADTEQLYEQAKTGLSFTDFRRMPDADARALLINCLRRWHVAHLCEPDKGQPFIDRAMDEIVGNGLMVWLAFDPYRLSTHPDSQASGLDARAFLQQLLAVSEHHTEDSLRQVVAERLFQKRVLPLYKQIPKGVEGERNACIRLLLEALSSYQLYPDKQYLDFVFAELTEEQKFHWIDVEQDGMAVSCSDEMGYGFDPLLALDQLNHVDPVRYRLFVARERIASRRHRDLMEQYFREISEFRSENRRPEREMVIGIIWKMKNIFRYMPLETYLELPLRELSGRGRIRWNGMFLGILPSRENHYENKFYNFSYRLELAQLRNLLANRFAEMERVLRETGEV